MRNLKLDIAYDGSGYHGWQTQPDRSTVQQTIETAIERITGAHSRLAGAGRTDAGVHARGQVANFQTASSIPIERFRAALQSQLPDDIVINAVSQVPDDFHAGYAARWKQYRYMILNDPLADPHLSRYVTHVRGSLDAAAMQRAAQDLVGKHDFRSFESHYPNKATSVRTVMSCRIQTGSQWPLWQSAFQCKTGSLDAAASPSKRQRFVYLDIVADGFLYNMVRAIMGTLIQIGIGRWPVTAAGEVLTAMDRRQAGPTAPPEGLYLMHVEYEREFQSR